MSIDNGIYVLFTDSEKGPEYRVAYAHSIGNIYGSWNVETAKYEGDLNSIKDTFSESEVFYTLNEALDYADAIQYDIGDTGDGICVINEFKDCGHIFI